MPGVQIAALIATLALAAIAPTRGFAQSDSNTFVLPNPDGRDPTFNDTRQGQPVTIEFASPDGDANHALADFPARLKLVNFWATWCVPCLRELPSLTALDARYADDTLRVIAISMDRAEVNQVSEFVASLELDGLNWFTDRSRDAGLAADVIALPTSIVVDASGNELGRITGSADWSSAEAVRLIESLLSEAP